MYRLGFLAGALLFLILGLILGSILGTFGFAVAAFILGFAAAAIGRKLYGNWSPGQVTVFGHAMLFMLAPGFFAAGMSSAGGNEGGLVVISFLGGLAIAVGAYLLLRAVVSRAYPRLVGRDPDRHWLADRSGWHFHPADDTVLADLREASLQLSGAPGAGGGPAHLAGARATAVVRGEANGMPFTAFDYYLPRRFSEPLVVSVCMVRLPHPLPPYRPQPALAAPEAEGQAAPCLFCGLAPHVEGRHPLVDNLHARLRGDWWVGGPWLVWQGSGYALFEGTAPRYDRGVSPGRLADSIDAATLLASQLDWSTLASYRDPASRAQHS